MTIYIHNSRTELAEIVYGLQVGVPCVCNKPRVCIDAVLDEIIGTKQVRNGPCPDETSVTAMTKVVAKYVDLNLPIPFVAPWGSEKPDGGTIDIAELCALKTMECLNDRVRQHYPPGIVCNVRVEDASAPHLFYYRADEARKEAKLYSDAFESLVQVLGCNAVKIKRESVLVDEATFNRVADEIVPLMECHINNLHSEEALENLKAVGWKSAVTSAMVQEYLTLYSRLYVGKSETEHRHILARYLSSALARHKLNLRGDDPSWNGSFLEMSFMEPTRGYKFPRRVFYRTIPASISSNHIPPWRAKGYLVVEQSDIVRPRLSCFGKPLSLNPATVTLSGNGSSVTLRADWQQLG